MGRFGEVVGWCKRRRRRRRERDGGQPSLLTLIKGHPGAFNNPCASNAGEGGNDTGYHSPEPTERSLLPHHFYPLSAQARGCENYCFYNNFRAALGEDVTLLLS